MIGPLNVTRPARSPGSQAVVILAAVVPRRPSITDLWDPGRIHALLSHDPGVTWPDRRGELIADAVLAERGTVAFLFESAADANLCRERLLAGRAT